MAQVHIRHEYVNVVVIKDGRAILELPWSAALELARAIQIHAKKAEEIATAENIALDQAILIRKGIPIGLSSDPKVQAEAAKEAAWNSDLRRYIPGGVKSESQVGAPTVKEKS